MTLLVGLGLAVIGLLDCSFSGFRASCGRLGLVRHVRNDVIASVRGLTIGLVLLGPVMVVVGIDVLLDGERLDVYGTAGGRMLAVYLPYAMLVLVALAVYGTLSWRRRFLATALLLGPFTLLRPLVATGGAVAGATAGDGRATVLAALAVVAVLAVEPLVGRCWYAAERPNPIRSGGTVGVRGVKSTRR